MTIIDYGLWADEKPEAEEMPDPVVVMGLTNTMMINRIFETTTSSDRSIFVMDGASMMYGIFDELTCPAKHKNDKHRTRPKSYSGKPRKW